MRSWIIVLLLSSLFEIKAQEVLTLEHALQIGLANRFDIMMAKNNQTRLELLDNYGQAGFLPSISAQAGQNYTINNTRQEFFSGDIREGNGVNSNAFSAAIAFDWTLFDGMNMFIQKDRLEKEAARGLEVYKWQVEQAVYDIKMAYLYVQESMEKILIIEEALAISADRKSLTQNKFDIGSVSAQALLQVQVDVNADSLELESAVIALRNAKIGLNAVLNRTPETDFEVEPISLSIEQRAYEDVVASALNNNKQMSVARLNEKLTDLQVKAVKSQFLPSLNLGSSYSYNRSEAEIGIFKFNRNAGLTYGLTARWNIFDGSRVSKLSQLARIEVENTKLSREQLELQLRTTLFMALDQMNQYKKLITLAEDNVRVARENVTIALDKLNIGSLTPLELRTAQQDLVLASYQRLLYSYQRKRLELELNFAAGIQ